MFLLYYETFFPEREIFFSILQTEFILDHRWDAHEEALALCRQSQLEQTSYFLQRDLIFMREVCCVVIVILKGV